MNNIDFSHNFDLMLNSFAVNSNTVSIELNEHEKSEFLTKAQEVLVISLYTGKNPYGESFEQTEELRRYLSSLIEEAEINPTQNTTGILGMESYSKFFTLPEDLWFITYEAVIVSDGKCENTTTVGVYPVRQDEYLKLRKNPFRGANEHRALRLDLSEGNVEIISKYNVTKYYVRYLHKLSPIVLVDFGDDITVNGESEATECELHEALHQKILELAVQMALRAKGMKTENNENR